MNDKISNIMTLEDFNEQIVRPMVINGIKSGSFDAVIKNEDERGKCICIYSDDMQIITAIVERYNILVKINV